MSRMERFFFFKKIQDELERSHKYDNYSFHQSLFEVEQMISEYKQKYPILEKPKEDIDTVLAYYQRDCDKLPMENMMEDPNNVFATIPCMDEIVDDMSDDDEDLYEDYMDEKTEMEYENETIELCKKKLPWLSVNDSDQSDKIMDLYDEQEEEFLFYFKRLQEISISNSFLSGQLIADIRKFLISHSNLELINPNKDFNLETNPILYLDYSECKNLFEMAYI